MAEVSIQKENQKRLKAKKFRNSMTFAELMAYSKVEAAQYAIDCWVNTRIMWMSAQDFVAKHVWQVKEPEFIEPMPEILEETESVQDTWEWALTKEDLQELLKANGIKYNKNLWNKKLMILAQENGLL